MCSKKNCSVHIFWIFQVSEVCHAVEKRVLLENNFTDFDQRMHSL